MFRFISWRSLLGTFAAGLMLGALGGCVSTTTPGGATVSIVDPGVVQATYSTFQAAVVAAWQTGQIKNASTYQKWQQDGATLYTALTAYNQAVAGGASTQAALGAAMSTAFANFVSDTIGLYGNRPLPPVNIPTTQAMLEPVWRVGPLVRVA